MLTLSYTLLDTCDPTMSEAMKVKLYTLLPPTTGAHPLNV